MYKCSTLAVLEISINWVKKVAPKLKTCEFTIWTCEKKMAAIFDSCEELWAKNVFNRVCAAICRWESNHRTTKKSSTSLRFRATFFEKNKTNKLSSIILEEKILFKGILFWVTAPWGDTMTTNKRNKESLKFFRIFQISP